MSSEPSNPELSESATALLRLVAMAKWFECQCIEQHYESCFRLGDFAGFAQWLRRRREHLQQEAKE